MASWNTRQEKGKGCGKGGGTGALSAFSEHSWGESGTWLTTFEVAFGERLGSPRASLYTFQRDLALAA